MRNSNSTASDSNASANSTKVNDLENNVSLKIKQEIDNKSNRINSPSPNASAPLSASQTQAQSQQNSSRQNSSRQ